MSNLIRFNLKELEKLNNPFANYILGRSYDLEENGATQDYKKALQYYMKNFDDYPLSQYSIGMSYLYGLGNELDVDEEKGDTILKYALPRLLQMQNDETLDSNERLYATFVEAAYYNYGIGGVEQNFERAREILEICAKLGHIAAYYDLGYKFYRDGVGGPADIEKSELFLRTAKNAGLKRAIEKYKEFGYSEMER
jgi:TPR repeat protein